MCWVTRRHRPRERPTSTFPGAPPVRRPVSIRSLIVTIPSLCLTNHPNNPFNVLNIAETKWRKDDDDDDDDVALSRRKWRIEKRLESVMIRRILSILDRIRRCAIEKFVFITRNSAIWCGLTIYILFSYYIYLFFVCNCETKRVKGSK